MNARKEILALPDHDLDGIRLDEIATIAIPEARKESSRFKKCKLSFPPFRPAVHTIAMPKRGGRPRSPREIHGAGCRPSAIAALLVHLSVPPLAAA